MEKIQVIERGFYFICCARGRLKRCLRVAAGQRNTALLLCTLGLEGENGGGGSALCQGKSEKGGEGVGVGCAEAGSTEGNDLAGELRRAGAGTNEPQEHGKAVGAVKGAGVVSAQSGDAGSVRELSKWKGLVKAPLQAEAVREGEN